MADEQSMGWVVLPPELVRYLTSKAGVRKAFRLAEFMVLWGLAEEALGRTIGREDFMEYWGESRAVVYGRLKEWRAVWPDDKDPGRVTAWVREVKGEAAIPVVIA